MKKLLLQTAFALTLLAVFPSFSHAQVNVPIVSGVATADVSQGQISFRVFLSTNVTSFQFIKPVSGETVTVLFTQDGTGGRTVTFASNIQNAPLVASAALASTAQNFQFDASSNSWFGVGAPGGGASGITGSGTPNTFTMFTGATTIGNAPLSFVNNIIIATNPFSQPASLFPCVNSASGTTNQLLVTRDASGNCINLPDAQTTKIVGVVQSGGGTSGSSQICKIGSCSIILEWRHRNGSDRRCVHLGCYTGSFRAGSNASSQWSYASRNA